MSDCCSKSKASDTQPDKKVVTPSCCGSEADSDSCSDNASFDKLLWGSLTLVALLYALHYLSGSLTGFISFELPAWLMTMALAAAELFNTMWWSVVLAALFVGLIARIPQEFVIAILGRGGSLKGILRATAAGVLMDLCSHGILMVGMKLYQKGASLGQVMAFLIASPWNSLSLTLIMIALIGLPWTLTFIALSMLIAVVSGLIFDRLVANSVLPGDEEHQGLPEGFQFWSEARTAWAATTVDKNWLKSILVEGIKGSRIVVRWLLFGILLAATIRGLVSLENFQDYFGPTLLGLAFTLLAATIIEVCSEGSTPIAADLMNRAQAPGNSFGFLMAGVATDYTEVMVIKDTMKSWKVALFLPLVTLPQVVVIALILNNMA